MQKVSRKELVQAVCELLARYYDDGGGVDLDNEALVNDYFREIGEKADFDDFYAARDGQKNGLKKFSVQFVAEHFSKAEAKD